MNAVEIKYEKVVVDLDNKKINVVIPREFTSVKKYKLALVESAQLRNNKKRHDEEFLGFLMVARKIRAELNLKGKHLKFELFAATEKEGLYRDERGHFSKQAF